MIDKIKKIEELYESLEEAKREVHEHVINTAFEYSKLDQKQYYDYPSQLRNFDEWDIDWGTVNCSWTDTWAYGGHAGGTVSFPVSYLYDNDAFEKYKQDCNDKTKKESDRKKNLDIQARKAMYNNLKREFEND